MPQISEEVLEELQQAQSELEANPAEEGPLLVAAGTTLSAAEVVAAAAGSGPAKHMLLDHTFNSTSQLLWAFAGEAWRYHSIATADEQGAVQVVFQADRVDVYWDANNVMTLIRCWKHF